MDIEYYKKGRDILYALNHSNGCQAFFVGGVVRSYIDNSDFTGIDICTDASLDKLRAIFTNHVVGVNDRGTMIVDVDGYKFNITPFKEGKHVVKHTQVDTIYTNLVKDLSTRDFTLNTIVITPSGSRVDILGGEKDFKKGILKTVINASESFKNDPIRMIRAIRFVSENNYHLTSQIKHALYSRAKLLEKVSYEELDYEMRLLNEGKFAKKAYRLLGKYGLNKHLGIFKKAALRMEKRFTKLSYDDFLCASLVLNEDLKDSYLLSVSNIEQFKKVYNVAVTNPKCKFDTLTLYSSGIDCLIRAYKINKFLGKTSVKQKTIEEEYNALPIKKTCDLEFKGEDILELCDGISAEVVQVIVDNVVFNILDAKLHNEREEIKAFIIKDIEQNNYATDIPVINVNDVPVIEVNKETTENTDDINDPNYRLEMLEKRVIEQQKNIEENDKLIDELLSGINTQLFSDVNEVVNQSIDKLKRMNYLGEDDRVLEQKLRKMLIDHLRSNRGNGSEN